MFSSEESQLLLLLIPTPQYSDIDPYLRCDTGKDSLLYLYSYDLCYSVNDAQNNRD